MIERDPDDLPEVTYDLTAEAEAADTDGDGMVTKEEAAAVVNEAIDQYSNPGTVERLKYNRE